MARELDEAVAAFDRRSTGPYTFVARRGAEGREGGRVAGCRAGGDGVTRRAREISVHALGETPGWLGFGMTPR